MSREDSLLELTVPFQLDIQALCQLECPPWGTPVDTLGRAPPIRRLMLTVEDSTRGFNPPIHRPQARDRSDELLRTGAIGMKRSVEWDVDIRSML